MKHNTIGKPPGSLDRHSISYGERQHCRGDSKKGGCNSMLHKSKTRERCSILDMIYSFLSVFTCMHLADPLFQKEYSAFSICKLYMYLGCKTGEKYKPSLSELED